MGFVARVSELQTLAEAHTAALAGSGELVVVTGDAGLGKSALLSRFASLAQAAGSTVVAGRCLEATGRPAYQPWLEIQGQLQNQGFLDREELPIPAVADSFPSALYEDTARALLDVAAANDLVVLVEDLHAANRETLLLLRHLAGRLAGSRLTVVASCRPVEAQAAPETGALMSDVLTLGREIALSPFDSAAVRTLLVDAQLDPGQADPVLRRTHGNALFVSTAIALLRSGGSLDAADVPTGIRQAVRRQVALAGEAHSSAVDVLRAAAVIGEEFSLGLVRRVYADEDLLAALDAVVGVGLVHEVAGTVARFRFSHALVRDTIYTDIPPGRRGAMHARVLDAADLLDADDETFHAVRAAAAGRAHEAVELATAAAGRAEGVYAFDTAAGHLRDALAALDLVVPSDPGRRSDLLTALARVVGRTGDHDAARRFGLAAADLAGRSGDELRQARALLAASGSVPFLAEDDDLLARLDECLDRMQPQSSVERARLLARRAVLAISRDDLDARDRLTAEAVALARSVGDDALYAEVLAARLHALWGSPDIDRRLSEAGRLTAVARPADAAMEARLWLLYYQLARPDIESAAAEVVAIEHLAGRTDWVRHVTYAASRRATVDTLTGHLDDAREGVQRAYEIAVAAREPDADAVRWGQLYALGWHVDLPDDQHEFLVDVGHRFLATPVHRVFRAALAVLDVRAGRHDEARQRLKEATTGGIDAIPQDMHRLWLLALVCWLCVELDEPELAHAADTALAPYDGQAIVVGAGVQWMGLVSHYRGLAARAYADTDTARRHLTRARDEYQRIGAIPWLVHAARDLTSPRRNPEVERQAGELGMRGPASTVGPTLTRTGELWLLRDGSSELMLKDSLGLNYLHQLMRTPHRPIRAVELAGTVDTAVDDDRIDDQALEAYRERITEIKAELENAEQDNDIDRITRLRVDLELLIHEVASATGLGGRHRKLDSPAERSRLNVTRAIRSALARITRQNPTLGDTLSAAVRTGHHCVYEPSRQ